jgi:hypothetical protein
MTFDILSPVVTTRYSQVWWAALEAVKMPEDVVKQFDGRTMAIVGFELDQVYKAKNGSYLSLPMTFSYNHHFESNMVGKGSRMEKIKIDGPQDPRLSDMQRMGHGIPEPWKGEAWVVKDLKPEGVTTPTNQAFGGANGGEVRKSFHGYAPGYAQLIHSPTEVHITPMQVSNSGSIILPNHHFTTRTLSPRSTPGIATRCRWAQPRCTRGRNPATPGLPPRVHTTASTRAYWNVP